MYQSKATVIRGNIWKSESTKELICIVHNAQCILYLTWLMVRAGYYYTFSICNLYEHMKHPKEYTGIQIQYNTVSTQALQQITVYFSYLFEGYLMSLAVTDSPSTSSNLWIVSVHSMLATNLDKYKRCVSLYASKIFGLINQLNLRQCE